MAEKEKADALEEIKTKLTELGGVNERTFDKLTDELGVETLEDLASLEVSDLTGAGMKLAKARKLVAELKNASKPAPAVAAAETRAIQTQFEALLPPVPTDDSWLNALKTGGILKVDESSYIAAIRAALADRAGLYAIPDALAKAKAVYDGIFSGVSVSSLPAPEKAAPKEGAGKAAAVEPARARTLSAMISDKTTASAFFMLFIFLSSIIFYL